MRLNSVIIHHYKLLLNGMLAVIGLTTHICSVQQCWQGHPHSYEQLIYVAILSTLLEDLERRQLGESSFNIRITSIKYLSLPRLLDGLIPQVRRCSK